MAKVHSYSDESEKVWVRTLELSGSDMRTVEYVVLTKKHRVLFAKIYYFRKPGGGYRRVGPLSIEHGETMSLIRADWRKLHNDYGVLKHSVLARQAFAEGLEKAEYEPTELTATDWL